MKPSGNFIAALLSLFIFACMFYFSLNWPEKASGFPSIIALVGMGFSALLVIMGLITTGPHSIKGKGKNGALLKDTVVMIIWVAILFGVTVVFGFWGGSILFMFAFMRIFGRETWKTTIIVTSILMVTIYITLSVAMNISIYGGIFKLTPF